MTAEQREEVLALVAQSPHTVAATLAEIGVPKSTFYRWRAQGQGKDRPARIPWNRLRPKEREAIVLEALCQPHLGCRELACWLTDQGALSVSEATVYRVLKAEGLIPDRAPERAPAAKEFRHKTKRINELWQSDATRFLVPGWGHYWLVSVLDDYSRRILAWDLVTDVKGATLADVIQLVVEATGVSEVPVEIRPRLLTDNGSGYISRAMAEYLRAHHIRHVRTAPHHAQTIGKTERYQRTLKEEVTLVVHLSPDELRTAIAQFIDYCNRLRLHEALKDVTPDDVWYGRREAILARRRALKVKTLLARRYCNRGLTQQSALGAGTPETVASPTPESVPFGRTTHTAGSPRT